MKINNKLKKLCGSELSNYLARNFNQPIVVSLIQKHFNNNGQDIKRINSSEYDKLKTFFNSISQSSEIVKPKTKVTATAMLASIGYDLIRAKSKNEAKEFKQYFRKNEELCKFKSDNTYSDTDVYFIVKNDASNIKPSLDPKRQDKYSVSVMSTKISKDGKNVLQITSRYNHTVSACDNTHGSNLNNIIDGLTEAFNHEFGYKINTKQNQVEFENFVCINDIYVFYEYEINGVKIGDNTIVTDKIINYNRDQYYTYSYYIIDLSTCKIIWPESIFEETKDSFVDFFNNIVEKIIFVDDIDTVDDNCSDQVCYIAKK